MQQETQQSQPLPMVLELFGHQRIAGHVSEHNFAGASFVRVDVPAVGTTPAFTKMFHPNAVYAFNPVDEETMLFVAGQCSVRPLTVFDLSEMRRKMQTSIPEKAFTGDLDEEEEEGDYREKSNDDGEEDEQKW